MRERRPLNIKNWNYQYAILTHCDNRFPVLLTLDLAPCHKEIDCAFRSQKNPCLLDLFLQPGDCCHLDADISYLLGRRKIDYGRLNSDFIKKGCNK